MAECHAIRAGFSTAFRRPAIFAAELAWRWAFTAAAWLLIAYGVLLFLRSVPVSDADMLGLSGIIPGRVLPTIAHILAGSGPKMVRVAFALLAGVTLLSWFSYSLGRSAVLRAVLDRDGSSRRLFGLNLLRTFCSLLVTLSYAGCVYLIFRAGQTQDSAHAASGAKDFTLLFAALAFLISWLWGKLDGRLTLANVFLLRDDAGVAHSIVRATEVSIRRMRQFAWIGLVFGFIKLVLWVGVFFATLTAFSMFAPLSAGLAWCAVFVVLMVYSALANFFSVGALAAQVRVIDWDEQST
jgi:hypothetical protein